MPSGRSQIIHLNNALALGALGQDAAIVGNTKIDGSRQQGCTLRRVRGAFQADGKTGSQGPIIFGFVPDLVASEIKEAFDSDPQDFEPGEAATDHANRPVHPVGTIPFTETKLGGLNYYWLHWQDFPSLRGYELSEHESFNIFAFNRGSALTSGTTLRFQGIIFADWLKD